MSSHRRYVVVRKVDETPNVLSVFLRAEGDTPLDAFRAGQYLSFDIPGIGERDYVLSAFSPRPKIYRITIAHRTQSPDIDRRSGAFWKHEASVGDGLRAAGPTGSFHLAQALDRPIVVLTRDIGEAVVAAMAEELALRAPKHRISFVHGTFDSTTFALKGKLTSLKADLPNATWKIVFSDPGRFDRQRKEYDEKGPLDVGECAALLPDDDFDVFVCGPSDFVASTEKSLNAFDPRRFRLFKQDMGVAIGPPISVMQEKELPPLEPRSIDFVRTGRKAIWTPERGTLLEFAEHLGIAAPFSCRTGMCGKCAQKIIAGETAKVRETSAKAHQDRRLLCSIVPMSDVEIDL